MTQTEHVAYLVHHHVTGALKPFPYPHSFVQVIAKVSAERKDATLLIEAGKTENKVPFVSRVQVHVRYRQHAINVLCTVGYDSGTSKFSSLLRSS